MNVQNLRTFHLDASTRWSGPTRWSNPTAPAVRYPRTASATLCRVRGCWHAVARVGAAPAPASDKARSPACAAPALPSGVPPASTPFQRLLRSLQPRCASACHLPRPPAALPLPSPALAPAVFPAAAPALASFGGRAWSDVVAARPVLPAKQSGRVPSGRAFVLRIKPGKKTAGLAPSGFNPSRLRGNRQTAAGCPCALRLQSHTVTLARSHAPCLCPAPVSGPQNPARKSSQGCKGRACYRQAGCHAPCFPRCYITRNSVRRPFGWSFVPLSRPAD